ncbi:MAG: hypothetical protein Q7T51_02865 [Candidatus Moranbacteria bacterium]|nr:hypothetical protein [Candidatus Moranbacteria bacterium]
MDIISHGLWGSGVFGQKSHKLFWLAFFFGIMPDLFSFGILFFHRIMIRFGIVSGDMPVQSFRPEHASLPFYVNPLYDLTHSLIIFLIIFFIIWLIRKKPLWEIGAWGLHILIDIPSHSNAFFPTPFLWPISDFHVNGISWGNPIIYIPNLILLALLYGWFFYSKKKKNT